MKMEPGQYETTKDAGENKTVFACQPHKTEARVKPRKPRYTPLIRVECQLFPDRTWKVSNSWEWHLQNYLKTDAESPKPWAGLHKAMRKHGVDWFYPSTAHHKPHSRGRRQAISEGMKRNPIWNRRVHTGVYYWRDKTEKPNVREWAISANGQFIVTKNLKAWCRTVAIPYDKVLAKVRFNGRWPYVPRAGLNIEHIRRWS